jgi:hypothetical protein
VQKYKENPTLVNGGVAAVAVAGASVFLVTEIEAILQVVGVVFALQFLARKLLFAEDRQQLFNDVKYLIQEKIAAGEAGDDLKRLADKVLDVDSFEGVADVVDEAGEEEAAVGDAGIPENVLEAREWINVWREKSKQPVAP